MVKGIFGTITGLQLWEAELGRQGALQTLVVKGVSILLIMPLRFMVVFPFMAFFTSSSSFLIFLIIRSLPCINYLVSLEVSLPLLFSGLLASSSLHLRLRCGRDVLLPSRRIRHLKSSFCFISSCTLAINAWLCWAITTGFGGAVMVESIHFKEFCQQRYDNLLYYVAIRRPHKWCQTKKTRNALSVHSSLVLMDKLDF